MQDDTTASSTYRFNLDIEGHQCAVEAKVPNQAISLPEFLPLVWRLQDALIGIWTQINAAEGKAVSCQKGCGACCRQLVPISGIEALHLQQVVQGLPEDARDRVSRRFAEAAEQLENLGLLEDLGKLATLGLDEKRQLGHAYFAAGIACPFLEQESCSIHAVRPSACREYLVTSPAANCARPSAETVNMLRHSAMFSSILPTFSDGKGDAPPQIIPLALALRQPETDNPLSAQSFYAPALFENFMNRLAALFARVG